MEGISGVKSQGITKAALTRERIWEALEEMKVEDRNEFYIEGHKCSMDDVEKINDSLIQENQKQKQYDHDRKGEILPESVGQTAGNGRCGSIKTEISVSCIRNRFTRGINGEKCKEAYECWGFIRALSVTSLTVAFEMEYKTPVEVDPDLSKNTGSAMDFLRSAWENAAIPFSTAERERYTQSRIMTTATGSTGKENRRYFPMGQIIWI